MSVSALYLNALVPDGSLHLHYCSDSSCQNCSQIKPPLFEDGEVSKQSASKLISRAATNRCRGFQPYGPSLAPWVVSRLFNLQRELSTLLQYSSFSPVFIQARLIGRLFFFLSSSWHETIATTANYVDVLVFQRILAAPASRYRLTRAPEVFPQIGGNVLACAKPLPDSVRTRLLCRKRNSTSRCIYPQVYANTPKNRIQLVLRPNGRRVITDRRSVLFSSGPCQMNHVSPRLHVFMHASGRTTIEHRSTMAAARGRERNDPRTNYIERQPVTTVICRKWVAHTVRSTASVPSSFSVLLVLKAVFC